MRRVKIKRKVNGKGEQEARETAKSICYLLSVVLIKRARGLQRCGLHMLELQTITNVHLSMFVLLLRIIDVCLPVPFTEYLPHATLLSQPSI